VLGIFGHGQVTGLGQALEQMHDVLKYYRIQNEQGGALLATGAAKHLDRLGCFAVTSSIGPGTTNLVTAAACATTNHVPLLLLCGDIFVDRQPDPVLQQIEHPHDLNIQASDSLRPVCRYWDRIVTPQALMTGVINAMRVLTDPADTGAACIAMPQDVQDMAYDYPEEFFKERVHRIDRRPISKPSLAEAVAKIRSKKRPFIIAGGGIHYSLATRSLKSLVERTGIPVGFTTAGNSALPWNHAQNLGGTGVMGTAAANKIAKTADLVIAIGTRLMDFTTVSKAAFQAPGVEILAINVSAFDAWKMDALHVIADAREAIDAINDELTKAEFHVDATYEAEYTRLKQDWNKEVDRLRAIGPDPGDVHLPQPAVIGVLNEFMGEHDVVINAAGSMPGDLLRTWRCKGTKTFHVEYAYSTMGYEIAAGLGIKLVDPDRNVYVIQGDGGYLMMHTELVTSLMEHKKIVILLFDSEGFNSINGLATGHGSEGFGKGSKGFGNELRDRDPESGKLVGPIHLIDYAACARAYGAAAYTVTSLDGLKDALQKAKNEEKTTLIHVKIKEFSQSPGYESWWRVGVAEVSTMPKVKAAREKMDANMKMVRKY
ncbi:MAG: 3D-(3,5/4)-trihydroxycyclohexane-1,2-dione acylhydrolase (decyclizing), partial [Candidatus Lokiarchaeota archaeon]|nr:3D-(3,5/4)-trihydroxycyclohexane-1,2-dione acylhydrolase (decyclizing) [Candidatus Lokiarchaeota archaeon]